MTLKPFGAAALLCCAAAMAPAQAAPYQLTSHVSGVADYFEVVGFGFSGLTDLSGHTPFDITYRASIDYSGSGSYSSGNYIPVEVTISIHGKAAQTSTIRGRFGLDYNTVESGPDAGKSFLDQYLEVYAWPSSFDEGLTFLHRVQVPGSSGGDRDGLPLDVPLAATSGWVDYTMYLAAPVGDIYWGRVSGEVTSASFTLAPVPEPTGWAMLGAGLVLTGMVGRRSARRLKQSSHRLPGVLPCA